MYIRRRIGIYFSILCIAYPVLYLLSRDDVYNDRDRITWDVNGRYSMLKFEYQLFGSISTVLIYQQEVSLSINCQNLLKMYQVSEVRI